MAKSTRLTNNLRQDICNAVLKHRFEKAEQLLEEAEHKLGDAVYEVMYPDKSLQQNHLEAAMDGEYPRQKGFSCYFAGQWASVVMSESRPFFFKDYNTRPKFPASSHLCEAFNGIEARKSKLAEEKDKVRAMVNGILFKPGTIGKLLEIWPEVEPFIPPETTPVHLPAVPRDEVNALLGLPSKDKE